MNINNGGYVSYVVDILFFVVDNYRGWSKLFVLHLGFMHGCIHKMGNKM